MITESMHFANQPLRFDVEVSKGGRIEVQSSLPAGSHVTVFVVEHETAELNDIMLSSLSSTEFWDNPEDDEDWNHA